MEKQFKAIVNHTGVCTGHYFFAGQETTLPESVIKALGQNVKVLEEIKPVVTEEKKEPVPATKEVKPEKDKMIKAAPVKK